MARRGPTCSVCASADLVRITADLVRGASARTVAERYGFNLRTMQRHLVHSDLPNPVPRVPGRAVVQAARAMVDLGHDVTAPVLASLPSRIELAGELRRIMDETRRLLAELRSCEKAPRHDLQLSALNSLAAHVEKLAKVSGALSDAPSVAVTNQVQVNVAAVLGTLAAQIEARLADLPVDGGTRAMVLDALVMDADAA